MAAVCISCMSVVPGRGHETLSSGWMSCGVGELRFSPNCVEWPCICKDFPAQLQSIICHQCARPHHVIKRGVFSRSHFHSSVHGFPTSRCQRITCTVSCRVGTSSSASSCLQTMCHFAAPLAKDIRVFTLSVHDALQWDDVDRDLDLCELWAGVGSVSKAAARRKLKTSCLEILLLPGDDVTTLTGFRKTLAVV